MHCYETKIIHRFGEIGLQVAADHLSDIAAIRAGRKLCREDECIEVWRGDVCVYSERATPIALIWPTVAGRASGKT
jgi:hypothetical protein